MGANTRLKVLFLRTGYGKPDSRCEKEIYTLSQEYTVELFGWDRNEAFSGVKRLQVRINDKEFIFHHVGIKAGIGEGFKEMLFPLVRFWLKEWIYLLRNRNEYDVLHVCDFDAAFPLLMLPKKPVFIYDIYDYYADAHKGPRAVLNVIRLLENLVIRKSDHVILCSEARKRQIWPARPRALTIIHNTPSAFFLENTVRRKFYIGGGRCKVVYVGMLSKDRFLIEMAEVISARDDVQFHVGGIGALENYFIEQAKKHRNITYYGKMDYSDVLVLEQECDIMTAIYDPDIPNHKYAAPNKFYEALMMKKPLIMMRDTGMDSYVEKYRLGEVIDGGREVFREGFSRALDRLIEEKEQWRQMGERGYRLYKEQFSWSEMEERLLRAYSTVHIRSLRRGGILPERMIVIWAGLEAGLTDKREGAHTMVAMQTEGTAA